MSLSRIAGVAEGVLSARRRPEGVEWLVSGLSLVLFFRGFAIRAILRATDEGHMLHKALGDRMAWLAALLLITAAYAPGTTTPAAPAPTATATTAARRA